MKEIQKMQAKIYGANNSLQKQYSQVLFLKLLEACEKYPSPLPEKFEGKGGHVAKKDILTNLDLGWKKYKKVKLNEATEEYKDENFNTVIQIYKNLLKYKYVESHQLNDFQEINFKLGECYLKNEDYDQAKECFLKIDNDDVLETYGEKKEAYLKKITDLKKPKKNESPVKNSVSSTGATPPPKKRQSNLENSSENLSPSLENNLSNSFHALSQTDVSQLPSVKKNLKPNSNSSNSTSSTPSSSSSSNKRPWSPTGQADSSENNPFKIKKLITSLDVSQTRSANIAAQVNSNSGSPALTLTPRFPLSPPPGSSPPPLSRDFQDRFTNPFPFSPPISTPGQLQQPTLNDNNSSLSREESSTNNSPLIRPDGAETVNKLWQTNEANKLEMAELKNQFKKIQEEKQELQNHKQTLIGQLTEAENELETLKQERDSFKTQLQEKEEESKRQNNSLKEQFEEKRIELEKQNQLLNNKLEETKKELELLKQNNNSLSPMLWEHFYKLIEEFIKEAQAYLEAANKDKATIEQVKHKSSFYAGAEGFFKKVKTAKEKDNLKEGIQALVDFQTGFGAKN